MKQSNKVYEHPHIKQHKDKNSNPNPVKIVWNKDTKKPTRHSPEEYL